MTLIHHLYRNDSLTRWGIFHNLDYPQEETGYIYLHMAGRQFGLLWSRRSA